MKNWVRITLVSFTLVGGTASFVYWSLSQLNNANDNFNKAFDSLMSISSFTMANTPPINSSDKTDEEQISTTTTEIIETPATSTDLELSFIFPQKGNNVYIGCTYQISLQSSTTIHSLETALVDADTMETAGPIASGLARENKIEPNSQSLNWKVGVVLPGEYYIKVSNINGVDLENKSEVFTISKMPKALDVKEQKKICEKSGGLF